MGGVTNALLHLLLSFVLLPCLAAGRRNLLPLIIIHHYRLVIWVVNFEHLNVSLGVAPASAASLFLRLRGDAEGVGAAGVWRVLAREGHLAHQVE